MFNHVYIEKCSDELTLRVIYANLLRNEHGNLAGLMKAVKERLTVLI